jgi:hypothetical protein
VDQSLVFLANLVVILLNHLANGFQQPVLDGLVLAGSVELEEGGQVGGVALDELVAERLGRLFLNKGEPSWVLEDSD